MFKKIIVLGVALIMCLGLFVGCGDNKPTEQAQSGAYFATGNGKESAVIFENNLSLFYSHERCDVFQFTKDGNSYVGENIRAKATIKFIGDELRVALSGVNGYSVPNKNLRLKRNTDIGLSEAATVQITAPEDIEINTHDLRWRFEELMDKGESVGNLLRSSGILGAEIEVKLTGEENFEHRQIRDFYTEPDCFFYVYYSDLNLTQGENIIRVTHLGGAFIKDNKIFKSNNSEAISFSATVDAQGNITVEKI